jgi:hypothetical protein
MTLELTGQLDQLGFGERIRTYLCHKAIDDGEPSDDRSGRRAQPAGVWNVVAAAHL